MGLIRAFHREFEGYQHYRLWSVYINKDLKGMERHRKGPFIINIEAIKMISSTQEDVNYLDN